MIGIVLAGGNGTRLFPLTASISKHLLAIYDKPLIYYPVSVLMMAGARKILIVCKSDQLKNYKCLLGDGSTLGVRFEYVLQDEPNGIGHALQLCKEHVAAQPVILALGDNIFHGQGFKDILRKASRLATHSAVLFTYNVSNPEEFGIISKLTPDTWTQIEEKPKNPKSNQAVTGLYFYPPDVFEKVSSIRPSKRGEIEITDLNNLYINLDNVVVYELGRGFAWFDAGTPSSMVRASTYMQTLSELQNTKVACLEEIAYQNDWISKSNLSKIIEYLPNSGYRDYLNTLS